MSEFKLENNLKKEYKLILAELEESRQLEREIKEMTNEHQQSVRDAKVSARGKAHYNYVFLASQNATLVSVRGTIRSLIKDLTDIRFKFNEQKMKEYSMNNTTAEDGGSGLGALLQELRMSNAESISAVTSKTADDEDDDGEYSVEGEDMDTFIEKQLEEDRLKASLKKNPFLKTLSILKETEFNLYYSINTDALVIMDIDGVVYGKDVLGEEVSGLFDKMMQTIVFDYDEESGVCRDQYKNIYSITE